jgi:SAM-dependent methyltransferase
MPDLKMLNIGCGSNYHPDWINLDVSPADHNVLKVDINNGLPFSSEIVAVCYSSHVLEHLDKAGASGLTAECFRVLKHGGVIRLVLPDLETMTREYLRVLDAVTSGDEARALDYDWMMLELYDQVVRNSAGGEMGRFLANLGEKDRSFVRSRIGAEAEGFWAPRQAKSGRHQLNTLVKRIPWGRLFKLLRVKLASWLVYLIAGKAALGSFRKGIFRDGGEVHQWMYDRYSLKRMLVQAGFVDVKICAANESRIPEFEKYSLDVLNGIVRKPDSLYVEASKP